MKRTKIDGKMQKEFIAKKLLLCYVLIVIGGLGTLAYLVVDVVLEIEAGYLFAMVLPLGVGIGLAAVFNSTVKVAEKSNKENEYSFSEQYMEIVTFYHGEEEGRRKLYYCDVFKSVETKNYFFVYADNVSAFPILKDTLDDTDTVRSYLSLGKER